MFHFWNAFTGLLCSVQVARARRIPPLRRWCCLSACPYQAEEQPTTSRFGPSLSIALACSSLTTFNSGSLTLILWLSLAPQPGRDSQYHTRPLAGLVYPVRWLHCQYAQHRVVANPAPYLDYRWLNTGSCQILRFARQLLAQLALRVAKPPPHFWFRGHLSNVRLLPIGSWAGFTALRSRPALRSCVCSFFLKSAELALCYTRDSHRTLGKLQFCH